MYRLAIAVLVAATAFSPDLEAQMRGMQRGPAPSPLSRPFFGGVRSHRGGFPIARPMDRRNLWINPALHHHRRFNIFFGNSCFGPFFDPFFCRQFLFRHSFIFSEPLLLPYPVYSAPYYPVAEPSAMRVGDGESDLAAEIARLRDEVELLRAQEASGEHARQAEAAAAQGRENEPTILVFRDGHQSEVRNYAIVGQTLWALTEQTARRIPISDLNTEATKKMNAERGVEIPLP